MVQVAAGPVNAHAFSVGEPDIAEPVEARFDFRQRRVLDVFMDLDGTQQTICEAVSQDPASATVTLRSLDCDLVREVLQ